MLGMPISKVFTGFTSHAVGPEGGKKARPIGSIWAWLQYGLQEGVTRDQHQEYQPDEDEIFVARIDFATYEGSSDFFDAECPEGRDG